MKNLNSLEVALLQSILEENKEKYPFLLNHFPLLKVKNREYTGVGSYSNFEYTSPIDELLINDLISSKKELLINGVKNELSYVLDITNGKINFLEIVTNGNEEWNGKYENFELK
jgi:hypothetical protein